MPRKIRISCLIAISLGLCVPSIFSQSPKILTPAEQCNYTEYSQHEAITQFLSLLDHSSDHLKVKVIGRSRETKEYGFKDLYLCILTEEGIEQSGNINRNKPTILIVSSQHGREQSGKEAALWLLRDLVLGELKPFLKRVNVLVIPQANPYGNWFDRRQNEQDLDLNRDHVKLESPEVEAVHQVFRMWMPEATIDVHEKGDDHYRVSIGCVSNPNIHPKIQEFSRAAVLAEVKKDLQNEGIAFHEYLVTQEMGVDSSAGVDYRPEDLAGREMMKRYSTTDLNDGRNSLGIYETLSFIQECASRHDIPTLRERTRWQYFGIRFFIESIARHSEEIIPLVLNLRSELQEKARVYSEEDLVHLRMRYARDEKEPVLRIKQFENSESPVRGIMKRDKKKGDILTAADVAPYPYPQEKKIVEEVVKNWFPLVEPTVSVSRPLGYVIPAQNLDVVEVLVRHGLEVQTFKNDTIVDVEAYRVNEVEKAKYDYLPPLKLEMDKLSLETAVHKGDFYVSCAQYGANLIPSLLEPQSLYGFIRYWKFKLVPEKGGIYPFFRVVKLQEMPLIPYKNWKEE